MNATLKISNRSITNWLSYVYASHSKTQLVKFNGNWKEKLILSQAIRIRIRITKKGRKIKYTILPVSLNQISFQIETYNNLWSLKNTMILFMKMVGLLKLRVPVKQCPSFSYHVIILRQIYRILLHFIDISQAILPKWPIHMNQHSSGKGSDK